ncbi:MAG: phosphomannomutase [Desulfovibrionaceae bacterium]
MDCFKAYDIRGKVPEQLDEALAERIGRAYAVALSPRRVAVGYDIRLSSGMISTALRHGLCVMGVDVVDIGLCGTEEVYHATFSQGLDGGIMITASHNPAEWNGMKFVAQGARPLYVGNGLERVRELALQNRFIDAPKYGRIEARDLRDQYVAYLLGMINVEELRPLRIAVNAGNGCAGPVLDQLEKRLPFQFCKIQHEPDGTFPNGVPNPLLPENRKATADLVREQGCDFGVAWDGDFDRCFLYDETGEFVEGYYLVGLLAQLMLGRNPGANIVHDPRLVWNTINTVQHCGGRPVRSKTGHSFIKQAMRDVDAVYGGEMSAHHYFRDFGYCDSGMLPWLFIAELLSGSKLSLSALLDESREKFPVSGEINRAVPDAEQVMDMIGRHYATEATALDHLDGLSMEFPLWRFNLRSSNTESLLRLNVESRGDVRLMRQKTDELLGMVDSFA